MRTSSDIVRHPDATSMAQRSECNMMIRRGVMVKTQLLMKKRVAYLHPLRIYESLHTFLIGKDEENLKDKTEEEAAEILKKMKQDFRRFKNRNCIVAPYNFKDHWICALIYPRDGKVLILDSLYYPRETYKEFLDNIEW